MQLISKRILNGKVNKSSHIKFCTLSRNNFRRILSLTEVVCIPSLTLFLLMPHVQPRDWDQLWDSKLLLQMLENTEKSSVIACA